VYNDDVYIYVKGNLVHIAILVTNTDRSAFAKAHPGDLAKFSALLAQVRPGWTFRGFDLTEGDFPPDPDAFDGVLIGGSPASVQDDASWIARLMALIRTLHDRGIPMVGACFGHQAIAKALGGTVGRNPGGWVMGAVETRFQGRTVCLAAAHSEQVLRLPEAAEVLGDGPGCPVGAYRIGPRVLATQYHPEMTPDFLAALVAEYAPALPPEAAARARASLGPALDGTAIAEAFAQTLETARA
jgi:GMP synthase-like glutamine amidotransferase